MALRRQQSLTKNTPDVHQIYLLPSGSDDMRASERPSACTEILIRTKKFCPERTSSLPRTEKILLRSEIILMRQEKVLIRVGKFPVGEEEILLADKKFYLVVDDSLSRR